MTRRIAVLLGNDGRPELSKSTGNVIAVGMNDNRRTAHVTGNQVDVFHCFAGEERYLTPEGPKSFAETVGTTQWVLTSGRGAHEGQWVQAPIRHFGEQEIWELTLRRNKRRKVIRTTAGHRWIVGRGQTRRSVATENLIPNQPLAHLRPLICDDVEASRDGIRQGAMFGDGSIQRRDYGKGTYGLITLWGEKAKDLGEYFDEIAPSHPAERESGITGLRYSSGMAGWTKELPSLSSDLGFLKGWLQGYLASDGTVDSHGKVSMSSSVIENLEYVRNVATLLGLGTYGITTKIRTGYGTGPTALHEVAFASGDLDASWLLRQRHRDAFSAVKHGHDRFGWTVESIERTDELADVYCATVPETESFALEDNIHTGNCPFCGSGAVVARSDMSIECSFCNSAFTVTISPMFPAFPMSMGGGQQPYPWPGRPDGGMDPAMMGDPSAQAGGNGFGGSLIPGGAGPDGDPGAGADGDDGSGEGGPSEGGEDEGTEAEVGGSKQPPFTKKKSARLYRTASGNTLPADEYLRHLALSTAENPNALAARIRQERRA